MGRHPVPGDIRSSGTSKRDWRFVGKVSGLSPTRLEINRASPSVINIVGGTTIVDCRPIHTVHSVRRFA